MRSSPIFSLRRAMIPSLLTMLGLYVAVTLYFWATQAEKILRPRPAGALESNFLSEDLRFIEIELETEEETDRLEAFWLASPEQDAPVILMLHGQGSTIDRELERGKFLRSLGCHCMLFMWQRSCKLGKQVRCQSMGVTSNNSRFFGTFHNLGAHGPTHHAEPVFR
ncbi:MAG: hypothetical protein NXI32_30915 [bacterium]|nr:hypothetical protein [bacterium]